MGFFVTRRPGSDGQAGSRVVSALRRGESGAFRHEVVSLRKARRQFRSGPVVIEGLRRNLSLGRHA